MRDERGFTVIEAIVSMAIFLVVLTGVLSFYDRTRLIHVAGEKKVITQQSARLSIAEVLRQLRMAGYFPENFSGTPPSPLLANPVLAGTDTALAIHGDADGSGSSSAFMFCLDGTTLRRTKAARTSASAYTCSSGDALAEGVTALTFAYFDVNDNPIPDPATAPYQLDSQNVGAVPNMATVTQRNAVRRVVVTLTARETLSGRAPETYTLTSDVLLRNAR